MVSALFAMAIFEKIPNLIRIVVAVLVIGGVLYYSFLEKRKES